LGKYVSAGPSLDKEKLLAIIKKSVARGQKSPSVLGEVDWKADPPSVINLARRIDRKRISVSWKNTPFTEAIKELNLLTGIPFVFSAKARAALKREDPKLDLKVKSLRVADILDLVTEEIGVFRFRIKGGAVLILTAQEFRPRVVLKIYNVGDILHRPRDFPAPALGFAALGSEEN